LFALKVALPVIVNIVGRPGAFIEQPIPKAADQAKPATRRMGGDNPHGKELDTFYWGNAAIHVAKYNIFVSFGNTNDAEISHSYFGGPATYYNPSGWKHQGVIPPKGVVLEAGSHT
jgi:hypothetical protein